MFVCVTMVTRSHLLRMYYIHPSNHLFHVHRCIVCLCALGNSFQLGMKEEEEEREVAA